MKILIFYASYGGGHFTAANSIKEYLEENYKDIDLKMIDCMKYINLNLEKVTTNAYKSMTKNAPKAWEAVYKISDKEPVLSISNFGNKIMSQKLNKLVQDFKPDVVVSTHPFSTQMIAYLKHKNKISFNLFNSSIALITIGMYINGILEIYGTTNNLVNYYFIFGLLLLI